MNPAAGRDFTPCAVALVGGEEGEDIGEFHAPHFNADPHCLVKSNRHRAIPQHARVPIQSDLLPVQAAIKRLVESARLSENAWAKKHRLNQSAINRIIRGERDPSTAVLQTIAEAVGLESWQLLAPDFGAGLHRVETTAGGTQITPVVPPGSPVRAALAPPLGGYALDIAKLLESIEDSTKRERAHARAVHAIEDVIDGLDEDDQSGAPKAAPAPAPQPTRPRAQHR